MANSSLDGPSLHTPVRTVTSVISVPSACAEPGITALELAELAELAAPVFLHGLAAVHGMHQFSVTDGMLGDAGPRALIFGLQRKIDFDTSCKSLKRLLLGLGIRCQGYGSETLATSDFWRGCCDGDFRELATDCQRSSQTAFCGIGLPHFRPPYSKSFSFTSNRRAVESSR